MALVAVVVTAAALFTGGPNATAPETGVAAGREVGGAIEPVWLSPADLGGSAPTSPPVEVCGNSSLLSGPSTAPPGAVVIPAGNNSEMTASYELAPNTTYWLAPGVHTLGTGPYSQFQPDPGDTFLGGPGAIVDGQGLNQFAFTFDPDTITSNVTLEYLTIENFVSGEGEGVVNQNGEPNWTVEYNTVGPNEFNGSNPGGAGVMLGSGSVVQYNCLTRNGEYGFSSFGGATNVTLSHNEIAFNDALGGYDHGGSSISCGCSGGGKIWISSNVTIADNYVHDNGNVGIWVDTDNTGVRISGNYVANNYAEGVIYEISYNGLIENNTFVRNAIGGGPGIAGFPDSAVYISESGFDPRVPNPLHERAFLVEDNVFDDNWGGVVVWENPNRYCSDGSDAVCTLVDPSVYTLTSCAANLAERSPLNYYDDCRWRAENVSVSHNLFAYAPADIGAACTAANFCGFNGLFSAYGEPPYSGPAVPINITFDQNNHFADNVYDGPWRFEAWSQGNPDNPVNWSVWRANVTDSCSTPSENESGTCDSGFAQDQGSSWNAAGGPVVLSFLADPPTVAVGASTHLVATVVGGIGAVGYTYTGLPPGCRSENSSSFVCSPEAPGNFRVSLFANDSLGHDALASAPLNVTAASSGPPPPGGSHPSGAGAWSVAWYALIGGAVAAGLAGLALVIRARRSRFRSPRPGGSPSSRENGSLR